MDIFCNICKNILKNPVECASCYTNFCEEHMKNFKNCPQCNKPFKPTKNSGLIKILDERTKEMTNRQIKIDREIVQCNLCSFESTKLNFCYHFAEEHKKELLEVFSRKKENNEDLKNSKGQGLKSSVLSLNDNVDNYNGQNLMDNNINNNSLNEIKPLNEKNNDNKHRSSKNMNENALKLKSNKNVNENAFKHKSNKIVNENVYSVNYFKKNSGEIFQPLSYMNDFEINNNAINGGIEPVSKSIIEFSINEIYYCGKKNDINCDCCIPDHICKKGNCLCFDCMKINIKKFGLKDKQLINKGGRISYLENGQYHCGCTTKVTFKNKIGEKKKSVGKCSKNFFCDECEILNKFKGYYLNYFY